jgi:hypothetical protein
MRKRRFGFKAIAGGVAECDRVRIRKNKELAVIVYSNNDHRNSEQSMVLRKLLGEGCLQGRNVDQPKETEWSIETAPWK